MKQTFIIATIVFFVFSQVLVAAGQDEGRQDRWEKYRAEKVAFLTNKLDLTPEEAQKFWPVYNQLEKAKMEAQQARHELEKKVRDAEENMSEKEIIKLTRTFTETLGNECELDAKYNEDFLKILPPAKVLKLYKAEGEFRMYMFRKYRDQNRGGNRDD